MTLRFGLHLAGCAALAAAVFGPMNALAAQHAFPIREGQQVRITAHSCGLQRQVLRFWGLRGDTLILTNHRGCPLKSITRLEAYMGRSVRVDRALGFPMLGLVAGALVGGVAGTVIAASSGSSGIEGMDTEVLGAFLGAVLGGGGGLIVGMVAGLQPHTRWKVVPTGRLLENAASPGRVGRVGVALQIWGPRIF